MKNLYKTNLVILIAVTLLIHITANTAKAERRPAQVGKENAGTTEHRVVFHDSNYDFELRRAMGYAISGGADLNECLMVAWQITEGDADSWWTAWHQMADMVKSWGEASLAKGHRVSGRQSFLRASNYFRAAEFFLHGNPKDPRIMQSWRLSRNMFRRAAELMEQQVKVLRIPYQNTTLPGYFLRPDHSNQPRKTLILMTGFDGTGEELYFNTAFFALKRGYNVLIFEGPGQGGALREQGLYFRPDWENVVKPIVDFALARKDVDPRRIALMGESMGGYLAPRAAAFEHRLAAIIANPGAFDLKGSGFPSAEAFDEMNAHPEETNKAVHQDMKSQIGFRWWINNGMFTTGKKTPLEFMNFWRQFTMQGVASQITTPTLVIVSEGDIFSTPQSQKRIYEELTCPKKLIVFQKDGVAPSHCQEGAKAEGNRRIFDWLDETLSAVEQ